MRISRPSPSLVVSIIALVVACAGTATAASVVLIKNSAQVKAGALSGTDLADKTVKNVKLSTNSVDARAIAKGAVSTSELKAGAVGTDQLAPGVKSALSAAGTSSNFVATEAVRADGPSSGAGPADVASVKALGIGTYLITATTTLAPTATDAGLVPELLKGSKNGEGHCRLDAAGDLADGYAPIAAPYALFSNTINLQITRTLSAPADIKLTCESNIGWKAGDTSIVALKLAGSTRQDSSR